MLPLLALIGGGVSLVDGLDSVSTLDRLGLVVDPALSDDTLMEPHLSLLSEDNSSALIDSKALDDFRIEHSPAVSRLLPHSSDLVPASDMADHAMIQGESLGQQAFPCWPGAPGITYNEFATWLGISYEQSPLKAMIQPFPFDVGYLTPGDIVSRPTYAGLIDDRLTHWLDDRITGVYQSAFDLEPAGTGQSSNLPAAELSAEERSHGLSALAELIRGGMIIAGLDEYSGAARRSAHDGKAAAAGRARGRCNHLSYTRSNGESDWHDQWRIRHENRRYSSTDAGLLFADGQPGSQPADHRAPRERAKLR